MDPQDPGSTPPKLAGLPDAALGVRATDDVDALIALATPRLRLQPAVVLDRRARPLASRLPSRTTLPHCSTDGTKPDPAERARIEDACKRGESSIFGSGAHPGMTNIVALTLTASCASIDHVRITESVDCLMYWSAETQGARVSAASRRRGPGGERPPRERGLRRVGHATAWPTPCRVTPSTRIDFDVTFTAATGDTDLGFMTIPAGTCRSVYGYHRGWVEDRNLISVGFNWTMGDHVVPPKPLKHGHDIQVFGAPNMRTVIHRLPHEEWDEEEFQPRLRYDLHRHGP